jgi:hypothetical protein
MQSLRPTKVDLRTLAVLAFNFDLVGANGDPDALEQTDDAAWRITWCSGSPMPGSVIRWRGPDETSAQHTYCSPA